jgi:tRNA (cytidine(34)-2'-O)-methyltransferase
VLGRRAHPSAGVSLRLTAHDCRRFRSDLAVVLVHPEIPPNTGNVIRLTANTATALHLVEPLGFRMDDRELKRAGLDYHEYANVQVHRDFAACREAIDAEAPRRWFAFTTQATRSLYEARFVRATSSCSGANRQAFPTS